MEYFEYACTYALKLIVNSAEKTLPGPKLDFEQDDAIKELISLHPKEEGMGKEPTDFNTSKIVIHHMQKYFFEITLQVIDGGDDTLNFRDRLATHRNCRNHCDQCLCDSSKCKCKEFTTALLVYGKPRSRHCVYAQKLLTVNDGSPSEFENNNYAFCINSYLDNEPEVLKKLSTKTNFAYYYIKCEAKEFHVINALSHSFVKAWENEKFKLKGGKKPENSPR